MMGKKWTVEEEDKILEKWGEVSIKKLAKSLKRSELAVINKARELGLKLSQVENQIDGILISDLSNVLGVTSAKINNWIAKHELPLKIWSISSTRTVKYINLDDFWKWAEKNPERIYTKLFEKRALGAEPLWMIEKRKDDWAKWSAFDSKILKELNEDGISMKEMALYFSCTVEDVRNELKFLLK